MRWLFVLVALAVTAPQLAAQHGTESPLRSAQTRTTASDPAAATLQPPLQDAETVRVEAEASAATSQQAILDEAFWRSVLAGVIVTVVSSLILRAIL